MPSVNRTSTIGDNGRRRRGDRPAAARINLTEIEDLMEDVGKIFITNDG